MDPAALGELEHGEDLGLGHAVFAVVDELGHDLGVGTALVVNELDRVVGVAEAEAPPHSHAELTCREKFASLLREVVHTLGRDKRRGMGPERFADRDSIKNKKAKPMNVFDPSGRKSLTPQRLLCDSAISATMQRLQIDRRKSQIDCSVRRLTQ